MDPYLVISTDCHAGLRPGGYREYVDPQHRDAFDVALAQQVAMTEEMENRGKESGAFAVVPKPVSVGLIFKALGLRERAT